MVDLVAGRKSFQIAMELWLIIFCEQGIEQMLRFKQISHGSVKLDEMQHAPIAEAAVCVCYAEPTRPCVTQCFNPGCQNENAKQ